MMIKSEKQIIWETKKEIYNRLYNAAFDKEKTEIQSMTAILIELRKIKEELE